MSTLREPANKLRSLPAHRLLHELLNYYDLTYLDYFFHIQDNPEIFVGKMQMVYGALRPHIYEK
jgi:hypothetical protein